jgi:oligopeptidase B
MRAIGAAPVPPLFKVNMDAGHGGSSGRYDYLREIAFDYAFILTRLVPFLSPSPPEGERAG